MASPAGPSDKHPSRVMLGRLSRQFTLLRGRDRVVGSWEFTMRRRRRLATVGIIVWACLPAAVGLFLWWGQSVRLSYSDVASILKDRGRLKRDFWEPLRVVGSDGAEWFVPIVRSKDDSMGCWRIQSGKRTDVGSFCPPEWFVFHQTAASLPDGNLLAVWSGSDGTTKGGESVAVAVNTGKAWSSPVIIATGAHVRCLDVACAANGQPHVLYVSPLEPRESYGPIEGFFPSKCWHTFHNGQTWAAPEPIQERGRFDIHNAILTLTPSRQLVVSVEIEGQFSLVDLGYPYLAVQVLGDSGWSKLTRLTLPRAMRLLCLAIAVAWTIAGILMWRRVRKKRRVLASPPPTPSR